MKRFYLILLLGVAAMLGGCDEPSAPVNHVTPRQAIIDTFDTVEIFENPHSNADYIVRTKDGAVWYVDMRMGAVYSRTLIFPANLPKP